MAESLRRNHSLRVVAKMQMALVSARVEGNLNQFVRISVPRNSMAEIKIRQNFGYVQEAEYRTHERTYFYMWCMYPGQDKLNLDFFGSIISRYDWGQNVELRLQKGLPL